MFGRLSYLPSFILTLYFFQQQRQEISIGIPPTTLPRISHKHVIISKEQYIIFPVTRLLIKTENKKTATGKLETHWKLLRDIRTKHRILGCWLLYAWKCIIFFKFWQDDEFGVNRNMCTTLSLCFRLLGLLYIWKQYILCKLCWHYSCSLILHIYY